MMYPRSCVLFSRMYLSILSSTSRSSGASAKNTYLASAYIIEEWSCWNAVTVVLLVQLRVLVPHVPLQVELFELREPAEAEQADDLAAKVVAEVALGPQALEGAAVAHAGRSDLKTRLVVTKRQDFFWRNK